MSAHTKNARSKARDERATTKSTARYRRLICAHSFGMAHEPKDARSILVDGAVSFKHELADLRGTEHRPKLRAGDPHAGPLSPHCDHDFFGTATGASAFLASGAAALGVSAGFVSAGFVSAGFVASFLGAGAGFVFRISWMYCSRILAHWS